MSKINSIFIVGPTASGKTDVSIEIAKRFNGEIVCADSMQVYKGIHIASAAPDEAEKQGVKHHLFEFIDLQNQFSVADYVLKAKECIEDISSRGKLPVIVGGTGLYINSLLDNTKFQTEETDETLRSQLEIEFDQKGAEEMLKELAKFDPETAARLHPNNRRRIIRAFEVYHQTGKTVTQQNAESHNEESDLNPLVIGIAYKNRELLYNRINLRVDLMIGKGLLQEAESTLKNESSKGAFQAIGHKELYGYLKGECSLTDACELLKQQTRRYAKRQLTWFRRDERIKWIFADEENVIENAITLTNNFLKEE